ncbi:MFS general substrate transporter [Bimuria novae-zelandiae CBS 107.79]|uniref:MFS general substrate transporter n=1 Tax=Bimuria novae-zelandiae CBS 107.79 TaxID=1447943 RepID=A0A6A5VQ40_9PLEO|nr:MFS general substrate transporter [Bimuria novae-zelandiae CBS 107.79]
MQERMTERGHNGDVPEDKAQAALETTNDDAHVETADSTYVSTGVLSVVVISVCCASFLVGLDQTIVAGAAPRITISFHALGDIGWWASAYLLTSASLQLVYGRLYTLFSTKWTYISAIAIFSIGSLICAVAPNSVAFIVGRAIAGSGAAGMMSGSVLVCFGINLPICASTVLGVCFSVKRRDKIHQKKSWQEKIRHFDLPGTILLTTALVCLILALQLGGIVYSWSNGRVIALFVVSGIVSLVFLLVQIMLPSQRSFPAEIIRNRNVSLAALFSGFISGGMFVVITYLPIWFQAVKGASALRSGGMMTPIIAPFVVMSALSGGITQAIGYYNPAIFFGVILATTGAGLLTTFDSTTTSSRQWIGYQLVYGLGAGAGVPSPMLVIQTVLSTANVPIGVSLVNLTQMLWSSVVVAIAQSVFVNELEKAVKAAPPNFDVSLLIKSGAADLGNTYTVEHLEKAIPAYSKAISRTFYIATALSCAALFLAAPVRWKSMKKKV